jgi:hypothetical protein
MLEDSWLYSIYSTSLSQKIPEDEFAK